MVTIQLKEDNYFCLPVRATPLQNRVMADQAEDWGDISASTIDPDYEEPFQDHEGQQMNERNRLFHLREVYLDALDKNFEEINNDDRFFAFTLAELQERRSSMGRDFREMERIHHLYRQQAMLVTNDILVSMSASLLEAVSKMHLRIQVLAETARSHPDPVTQHTTFRQFATAVTNNSTINPDGQVIRVEQAHRPQIGKFNGSMADWPAFRDLFVSEVHNRALDPVRKLLLLKDACIGAAADTLGSWQPTADNYQLATTTTNITSFTDCSQHSMQPASRRRKRTMQSERSGTH